MNSAIDSVPEGSGPLDLGATVDSPHWAMPFTDIKPHARGGLGEVFRATDPELHRTVAVKCLQSRHAESPGSLQRFLLEAEVTARLEHPGVVPVYGFYAGGGRPAYAMRFIEGRTFAEEITLYHAGAADPVGFRKLLQAFLQLCQTVAYAHSRGVIHRDLKPANVMLGRFGETLVVDWGLAKVVGRPEAAQAAGVGETLVPLSGASGTGDTEMGSAVGTPAYMSPEQAVGRWDVVAQASDIYGLGAVLYTLLTGRAPLEKGNWPEMNQKIQRGDITLPRLVKPDVSRALEAICLKAMAVDPEKRYVSAETLAADIEHWMADEPVTAAPDSLTTRAWRWMKRHRTLVSGVAVLLVAAVVGLSIGTALLQAARVETEKQRLEAVLARGNAESLSRFLVDGILKQANPRNNPVGDKLTVRQLLDQASEELLAQSKLNVQPTVEVELHEVIGQAYEYLDASERAEMHFHRAVQLRTILSGPESPQTLAMGNRLILSIINLGRLRESQSLATKAYHDCIRELGKEHRETAEAINNLAELRTLERNFTEAIPLRREAVKVMLSRGGREDNKTLEFENNLAITLVLAGEAEEAVSILQSVADRRLVLHPRDPETATTLANLGGALIALNRFADASNVLQNAVSLQENSRGEQSDAALDARNLYGYALEGEEKWKEAEIAFQAVLAKREQSGKEAMQSPAGLERTYAHLARLNAKQKDWKREAEYLVKLLQSQRPDPSRSFDTQRSSLADILAGAAEGESASALLKEYLEAIKARTWPADWLGIEVKSLYGDLLRRQGKMEAAEPVLLEAAKEIPKAIGAPKWGVAAIRKRVADFYDAARKPDEAAKWR